MELWKSLVHQGKRLCKLVDLGSGSKDWQDRRGPEFRGIVGPTSANEINSIDMGAHGRASGVKA